MKRPDLDKERSEQKHTLAEFLALYNKDLPSTFPRASTAVLNEYKKAYPSQFTAVGLWSLDLHRKKIMDWLPQYLKAHAKTK